MKKEIFKKKDINGGEISTFSIGLESGENDLCGFIQGVDILPVLPDNIKLFEDKEGIWFDIYSNSIDRNIFLSIMKNKKTLLYSKAMERIELLQRQGLTSPGIIQIMDNLLPKKYKIHGYTEKEIFPEELKFYTSLPKERSIKYFDNII